MVKFWDNLMRKKKLFLFLFAIFLLISLSSYNLLYHISNQARQTTQNDLDITSQPLTGYVNSLILKINDAYELSFGNNFTQAQIRVTEQLLDYPAYVRVFDKTGRLLAGEYTTAVEPTMDADADDADVSAVDATVLPVQYRFSEQTKAYALQLEPGCTIEVASPNAFFTSTLSNKIAASYTPSSSPETYVVMPFGLRKKSWSAAQGETEMYNMVRDYFVTALRSYQAELPEEILLNKNLDSSKKSQAIIAFYQLRAADQAQFVDFIEQLKRGGSPRITYLGKNEYSLGDQVDFASLVEVNDPEDGQITHVDVQTSADLSKVGTYDVMYSATDSDQNRSSLTVRISVSENQSDVIYGTVSADANINSAQQTWGSLSSLLPSSIANITSSLPREESYNTISSSQEEDSSSGDNNTSPDVTTATPVQYQPTSTQTEPEEKEPDTTDKPSLKFWQIGLGIVGVLVVLGLIRFVSDHYMR